MMLLLLMLMLMLMMMMQTIFPLFVNPTLRKFCTVASRYLGKNWNL
jgi:hypothetical protein